ncbi:hypothetical protein DZF92_10985 [Clavibacter michiganensis subsp. insidiosus]|nr:hypothetical protein DZF92_10985 [Clavibacter michiganensis subsp. insidiosus]RMC86191.1 hypothetical protein CmiCFBP2404_06175 [Clavibacter michiganensis subsp. insidiosus]
MTITLSKALQAVRIRYEQVCTKNTIVERGCGYLKHIFSASLVGGRLTIPLFAVPLPAGSLG